MAEKDEITDLGSVVYQKQTRVWAYWVQKVSAAENAMDKVRNAAEWEKNYNRLAGGTEVQVGKQTVVSSDEIGDAVEELLNLCYPTTPLPMLSADRPEDEQIIETCEWLIYRELKSANARRHLRRLIQDAVCCPFGYLRVTYEPPGEPVSETPRPEPELPEPVLAQQKMQVEAEHSAALTGQQLQLQPNDEHWFHEAEHRIELTQFNPVSLPYWLLSVHLSEHGIASAATPSQPGSIKISHVRPHDFVYDHEAKCFEDRQWEAERTYEHIDDLKKDPLLQNVDGVRLDTARSSDDDEGVGRGFVGDSPRTSETSESPSYATVWRIHDRRNNLLIILSASHDNNVPLLVRPWPYRAEVYHQLDLHPINNKTEAKGKTIMSKAWAMQELLDEVIAKRQQHMKKFGTKKVFIESGILEGTAKAQFMDAEQTIVTVNPGDVDKIKIFDTVTPPSDVFAYSQELPQKIRRTIGVYETMTGVPKAKTATQAQLLSNREQARTNSKQDLIADMLGEVCQSILMFHKQFTSTKIMVEMRGAADGVRWRQLRPEEIPEQMHVTIDDWSWGNTNPDLRRRQWTELLPIIAGMPGLDIQKVLIETFRRHEIRNPERFLQTPMPMMPPQSGQQPVSGPPNLTPPPGEGQVAGNAVGLQTRGQGPAMPATAGVTSAG